MKFKSLKPHNQFLNVLRMRWQHEVAYHLSTMYLPTLIHQLQKLLSVHELCKCLAKDNQLSQNEYNRYNKTIDKKCLFGI